MTRLGIGCRGQSLMFLLLCILSEAQVAYPAHDERQRYPSRPSYGGCDHTNIAEMAEGHRLMLAGRFEEAEARIRAGIEATERQVSQRGRLVRACLLNMQGFMALQKRHAESAAAWFRLGLNVNAKDARLTAILTSNLASAYLAMKQLDKAENLASLAIVQSNRLFGPDHPESLFAESTIAGVHFARGDFVRAEPLYRRILYRAEAAWGGGAYETALAATNLAMIYLSQHQFAQARSLFEKSLTGLRASTHRAKDEIAIAEANLALACAAGGLRREANVWLDRAFSSVRQDAASDEATLAIVLERGANARFVLGDHEGGRELFERALTTMESRFGPESQQLIEGLERYSALLHASRNKKRLNLRRKALLSKTVPASGTR